MTLGHINRSPSFSGVGSSDRSAVVLQRTGVVRQQIQNGLVRVRMRSGHSSIDSSNGRGRFVLQVSPSLNHVQRFKFSNLSPYSTIPEVGGGTSSHCGVVRCVGHQHQHVTRRSQGVTGSDGGHTHHSASSANSSGDSDVDFLLGRQVTNGSTSRIRQVDLHQVCIVCIRDEVQGGGSQYAWQGGDFTYGKLSHDYVLEKLIGKFRLSDCNKKNVLLVLPHNKLTFISKHLDLGLRIKKQLILLCQYLLLLRL